MLRGVIVSYKRGGNTQYNKVMLVKIKDYKGKNVSELIGKKVVYEDKHGNRYRGKVVRTHGKKNVVQVRFETPLPGQALGKNCLIVM